MSEYLHEIVRVEWAVEIYVTDQYGMRSHDSEVLYTKGLPSFAEATIHMGEMSTDHPYVKGRRVPIKPYNPHTYVDIGVFCRRIVVDRYYAERGVQR